MFRAHIPRCTHIKTNGTHCGSPALRGRRFGYFHKNWREQRVRLNTKRRANTSITLPVLEDADSIQVALMPVLRLILAGQIDTKMAGLVLYGLQTASLNLRQMQLDPFKKERIVVHPEWVPNTGVGDDEEEESEDEEDLDSVDESDEEDVGEETITASPQAEENDGDRSTNREARRKQKSAHAPPTRRSRRHSAAKRSRTRCTDPYEDDDGDVDDAPLDQNAVRALRYVAAADRRARKEAADARWQEPRRRRR
jgi:hypothetical protein